MFAIEFGTGPEWSKWYNRDRNAEPYMATGSLEGATKYETLEDAKIALSRVQKSKAYKQASRKTARIIEI